MILHMAVEDGEPTLADIISSELSAATAEALADVYAISEAADALEEDGIAGRTGDLGQHERATRDLVGAAFTGHCHRGDSGEHAIPLHRYSFTLHKYSAKFEAEVIVSDVVVDAQKWVVLLGTAEFLLTEFLKLLRLLGGTDSVEPAAEFLGEESGSDVVVATVDGEDKYTAGMCP
jgi:hypothetical protein